MITVTNKELLNPGTVATLNKVVDTDLPVKLSFKIIKIVESVNETLKIVNTARQKLVEKYAEKDDDGNIVPMENDGIKIDEEKRDDFVSEFEEFNLIENEIAGDKLDIDDLAGINIKPKELAIIRWLIKD